MVLDKNGQINLWIRGYCQLFLVLEMCLSIPTIRDIAVIVLFYYFFSVSRSSLKVLEVKAIKVI